MVGGVKRFDEVGEHEECRMELKILDPRSMRVTPLHLFGSLRSPLLGTVTTWPSCHSEKSVSSFQYELKKFNKGSKFISSRALKTSRGTSFRPGDLPFANFRTAFFSYSQVIGALSSGIIMRWRMPARTVKSTGRCAWDTRVRWGPITDAFSASFVARSPFGRRNHMTVGFLW